MAAAGAGPGQLQRSAAGPGRRADAGLLLPGLAAGAAAVEGCPSWPRPCALPLPTGHPGSCAVCHPPTHPPAWLSPPGSPGSEGAYASALTGSPLWSPASVLQHFSQDSPPPGAAAGATGAAAMYAGGGCGWCCAAA